MISYGLALQENSFKKRSKLESEIIRGHAENITIDSKACNQRFILVPLVCQQVR